MGALAARSCEAEREQASTTGLRDKMSARWGAMSYTDGPAADAGSAFSPSPLFGCGGKRIRKEATRGDDPYFIGVQGSERQFVWIEAAVENAGRRTVLYR